MAGSVEMGKYHMKFSQERLFHSHQILYFHRKKPTLEPNTFHDFSPHYYENSLEIISFRKNKILTKQFFIH